MKRVITISVITIALLALIVSKLMSNKKDAEAKIYIHDINTAVFVEASSPSIHTFENSFNFLGTFEAAKQNIISSDAQGKLIRLTFEEGTRVSQGQLLAKVDDELLKLQLNNALVQIEGYQKDDERYSKLVNDNAVPAVQVEKNKLGLRSAIISKEQVEKQIKNTNITAPFSGVITKKMVDLGSFLGYGTQVAEITDISSLKLTISVPERDILKFTLGQQVKVSADIYGTKEFTGKISNVSVQADKSHNFKVQVLVSNAKSELRSGMYGSASLMNKESKTALSIPRKALVGSTKNPQAYVIKNGKAVLTSFSSGASDGDYIEVVSGISKNDQIVVKGQVNLQNNSNVKTK
ncbi:MAG: efflux RND transporter periplasmic adaptor subunit [Bacteroidota bacterium]